MYRHAARLRRHDASNRPIVERRGSQAGGAGEARTEGLISPQGVSHFGADIGTISGRCGLAVGGLWRGDGQGHRIITGLVSRDVFVWITVCVRYAGRYDLPIGRAFGFDYASAQSF